LYSDDDLRIFDEVKEKARLHTLQNKLTRTEKAALALLIGANISINDLTDLVRAKAQKIL
jgi:hypothetical protein